MDCYQVRKSISAFLDEQVVEAERRGVSQHIELCSSCASTLKGVRAVRSELRAIQADEVPSGISWSLRALASREAARRRRYAGVMSWLKETTERFRFRLDPLMRPLALPAFGGFASAILLFSLVMTNFRGIVIAHPNDVPTMLTTEAQLLSSPPVNVESDYLVLDVLVDEQGRVLDYQFPEGFGKMKTIDAQKRLEHTLRFSTFKPATNFGQPVLGWVRVSFSTQRTEMDVRG